MTKEEIRDYSLRITQSSKSQLVVVTYEIIINYMYSAKISSELDNQDDFVNNIKKAKGFLDNLLSSLDMKYKVSSELMRIYLYINRCMVEAIAKKESDKIDHLINIMDKLRITFLEVSKEDKSGPIIKDVQKVYAGLTYGKGTLNECILR